MFLYPEQTICSNVTYGLLSTTFFANKKSLRDLSGHTVIIVTDELANDNLSRAAADIILRRGCKTSCSAVSHQKRCRTSLTWRTAR